MAAVEGICGPGAFSLISVVHGNLTKPDEEIAYLVLKGLTINMNMDDKTVGCMCGNKCVTDPDSRWKGQDYLNFPPCARQFMDNIFKGNNNCTHERNQGKTFRFGLSICGNGVKEPSETCDCRVGDVNCHKCCDIEKGCLMTKAPGCAYPDPAVDPGVPTQIPVPITQATTTTTKRTSSTEAGTTVTTASSPKQSDSENQSSTTELPIHTNGTSAKPESESIDVTWIVVPLVILIIILIGVTAFAVVYKIRNRTMTSGRQSSLSSLKSDSKRISETSLPGKLKNRPLKFQAPSSHYERKRSRTPSDPTI
jgi:hypothetical protein